MPDFALCLCGDVMTGRGIDQVLPHPGEDELHEQHVTSARHYVAFAQERNGPIPHPAAFEYIWGDALDHFRRCDVRIANLETGITASREFWPKAVHYKMSPANVACLSRAGIDCCVLGNNHAIDYGYAGLLETLDTLDHTGIAYAGAGRNEAQAQAPAVKTIAGKGRVVVFSFGSTTSGIPADWAAAPEKPGVNLLSDFSDATGERISAQIRAVKREGDIVVVSVHWGPNFGYEIPAEQMLFAHRLIDVANVDVIHGHSSHHVKAIEVYAGKAIFYGCGDFINDYEGIPGYEEFRDDLVLLYRLEVCSPHGRLTRLSMIPFRIKRFRLERAARDEASWLCETLNREGERFGTRWRLTKETVIELVS